MKLAEALLLRGDLQKKQSSLRERIGQNCLIQEGDDPHEDPKALLKEATEVVEQIKQLVFAINRTNLKNSLSDGRTLTEAIAERDSLTQRHSLLQHVVASSKKDPYRYGASEIKWVAMLDIGQIQNQADDVAKAIRELNAKIQEANWQIELDE